MTVVFSVFVLYDYYFFVFVVVRFLESVYVSMGLFFVI